MLVSPFNRKVTVGDATFTLGVSMAAKIAFMRCQGTKGDDVDIDYAELLEAMKKYNVVLGWENVMMTNPEGEIVPMKFTAANYESLDLAVQLAVAAEAFNVAFGEVPNEVGSENK